MRRLADSVVNGLLRLAPWYRPEDLEERVDRATDAIEDSRAARLAAEKSVGRRLGSYGRVRLPR